MAPPFSLSARLRPHAPALAGMAVCVLGGTLATMALVPLARYAAATLGAPTPAGLGMMVGALIGLYTAKGVFGFGQAALAQRVALAVTADLREEVYAHLLELDLRALTGLRTAEAASKLVQDLGVVKDALAAVLGEVVLAVAVIVYSLGYALWLDPRLALATFVAAPLVAWAIAGFGRRLQAQSGAIQARVADIFVGAGETLAGLPVVRAFGQQQAAAERFAADNRRHQRALFAGAVIQALQPAVIALLQTLAIGAVLWVGGQEILAHRLAAADLVAFAAAIAVAIDPTLQLAQAWGRAQSARGALDRVLALRELPRRAAVAAAGGQGVAVSGLRFGYDPERPVLDGVDLEARTGEVVAICGASGSGKSTLAALLLGLYLPDAGSVAVEGPMAWVPQDPTLFALSVAENVAFGRPGATRAEVEAACRAAHAHDFIMALPAGYDTPLGERGAALSGGQRQRLAIARALLVDPRVLVLDEATAALDAESQAAVQRGLAALMAGRTTVVIAHRLDAIAHADRVYVLERGRVTQSGAPRELMAVAGPLRRLVDAMGPSGGDSPPVG